MFSSFTFSFDFGSRYHVFSEKMLYLVGLGLGDAKDITVKGLEIVERCKRVYLEAYTSILGVGKNALVSEYMSVKQSLTQFSR